jgi:hypothetical protein
VEELEVRLLSACRIRIDDEPVPARVRERQRLADRPVRRDRRVLVDDRGEVVPHEDQVHARVRPRAALELRERLPVGLADDERDRGRLARLDRPGRLEVGDPERARGADRREVGPRRAAAAAGQHERDEGQWGEPADHDDPLGGKR